MPQSADIRHLKECPVCSGTHLQPFLVCRDHTVSGADFQLQKCEDCGFVFTNPVPTEAAIGPYYQSEDYVSHSNTSKGLINSVYQAVKRYTLKQKLKFVRKQTGLHTGKLLDYGCGTGSFAGTMQQAGWQVLGLEPAEEARTLAMQTAPGLQTDFPPRLFALPSATFDAITLWHVLEHIHELNPVLAELVRVLRPSGRLLIAVPNCASYDAQAYGAGWAAYDVPRHLYHFTPPVLAQLGQRHGLQLLHKKLMPFDSFYVSMLSEKHRVGQLTFSGLVRAFFRGLASNLAAWRNVDRSSSIIYTFALAPAEG